MISTKTAALSNAELTQVYLNARTTSGQCAGHHKGLRNDALVSEYQEEMLSRGLGVPGPELKGVFNGEGSY